MRIISFGCSITFGTELPDAEDDGFYDSTPQFKLSKLTWPAQIACSLGKEYMCMAKGGAGNLLVLDRVLLRLCDSSNDFFIINWTFADRFDYSDPAGRHYANGRNDYVTAIPGKVNSISDFYFKNVHSEFRDKITTLIYIKTALDSLISTGAKFLMTSLDPILFCRRWHAPPHVVKLQDAIRPYIHHFEGKNFLDWSRDRGFEITPSGHPLKEAHTAAAEIMLPKIKQILELGVNKK